MRGAARKQAPPKPGLRALVSGMLELPQEVVLNLPLLSIIGSRELTIENHKGILEYSETFTRVSTSSGVIAVKGRALTLSRVTSEAVKISGTITELSYIQ